MNHHNVLNSVKYKRKSPLARALNRVSNPLAQVFEFNIRDNLMKNVVRNMYAYMWFYRIGGHSSSMIDNLHIIGTPCLATVSSIRRTRCIKSVPNYSYYLSNFMHCRSKNGYILYVTGVTYGTK